MTINKDYEPDNKEIFILFCAGVFAALLLFIV